VSHSGRLVIPVAALLTAASFSGFKTKIPVSKEPPGTSKDAKDYEALVEEELRKFKEKKFR
jgi:hypothetical protein